MNVSKGDLAIVKGLTNNYHLNGRIVKVKEYAGFHSNSHWWLAESNMVISGINIDNQFVQGTEMKFRDNKLTKISPPQDQLIPDPIEVPIDQPEMA